MLEFLPGMKPEYPVNHMYLEHLRKEGTHHMVGLETRGTGAGLPTRTVIEVGIPSQLIEAAAAQCEASLIVIGTPGRTGLDHILVGSTAERVVRTALYPVLTVNARDGASSQTPGPADGPGFGRLLILIDFSPCSLNALEYGLQFAIHV